MGIVHGDIQPAVIFIGDHGEVVLQNWQLSAAVGDRLQPTGNASVASSRGGTRGVMMESRHYLSNRRRYSLSLRVKTTAAATAQDCLA